MKKFLLFILLSPAFAAVGHSAVLTGNVNTSPEANANLTIAGSLDWAIWNRTSNINSVPTNEPVDGPNLIGNLSAVGTTANVGGFGGSTQTFTYTNGANAPTSVSGVTMGLATNATLETLGNGVELSISGDPTKIYSINIWATGYRGEGTLTASLAGATPVSLLSGTFGNTKSPVLFTLTFQPNSALDLLNVRFVLSTNGDGASSHVGIQAVTMSVVPEPSATLLLAGGLLAMTLFRRRGKA